MVSKNSLFRLIFYIKFLLLRYPYTYIAVNVLYYTTQQISPKSCLAVTFQCHHSGYWLLMLYIFQFVFPREIIIAKLIWNSLGVIRLWLLRRQLLKLAINDSLFYWRDLYHFTVLFIEVVWFYADELPLANLLILQIDQGSSTTTHTASTKSDFLRDPAIQPLGFYTWPWLIRYYPSSKIWSRTRHKY